MATRKTPAEALQKWQQRVSGAQQYYQQGVQNSKDWAAAAQAAGPARDAGLQQAIATGSIDRGIQRLGTAGWRSKTLAKGPQNWASAVASAGPAYMTGIQRAYTYLDQADAAVANMPRGGFADNVQRMVTYVTTVHQAAQQYKQNG